MTNARRGSWASRVFALVSASVVIALAVGGLLVVDAHREARDAAGEYTRGVAEAVALDPGVTTALAALPDSGAAATSAGLQPFAVAVMAAASVDFLTIMTPDGTRVTHRDPSEIGRPYLGTVPAGAQTVTEEFTGTLGPSVRTIVPVKAGGTVVGFVAAGVTLGSIAADVAPRLLFVAALAVALVLAGLGGALVARRRTRAVAGDLPALGVRDTIAAYESVRTMGDALRAQTHEHGNRLHTAVALIELGRTQEAVDVLVATSAKSQALVDQVTARLDGDPTVAALLLGKASQAAERGIAWTAEIAPDAPRSILSPVDQVALVGNLVDNAMDAAASAEPPRWVRVGLARAEEGGLWLWVADSGSGVPAALRGRVFDRGFSTKPADATGRGVGLALVRTLVDDAGGTIAMDDDPTVFRVHLPTRGSP